MAGQQKMQIVDGVSVGLLATEHLQSLIKVGDTVKMNCNNSDRYGRIVCEIFKNGVNINQKMVADGYAFVLTKYCKNDEYAHAYNLAQTNKKGLHALKNFDKKNPQEFRNCVRSHSKLDCNL